MAAGTFDLHVVPGERYDVYFDLKAGVAAMPLTPWTPVAVIYSERAVLATNLGAEPEFVLEKEPDATVGRIGLMLGTTLTEMFLRPLRGTGELTWRLDLVDASAGPDNLVPVLKGDVILESPW